MSTVHRTRIDFKQLPKIHQGPLVEELLSMDRATFSGAEPRHLLPYLYDEAALSVPMTLYRDDQGRLVGQNIAPITGLLVDGRAVAVMGCIAGLLPEFRRGGRTQIDGIRMAMKFKLRHPRVPLYFATGMLQPRVYELFADLTPHIYPRHERPTPPECAAVLRALAQSDETLSERAEGIYAQGSLPAARATADEQRRLSQVSSPHRAFFLQNIPDYAAGVGLVTVLRLDLATTLKASSMLLLRSLRRAL